MTTTKHLETQPRTHPVVDMSQFRAACKKAYAERRWYGQITGMKLTQITEKALQDARNHNDETRDRDVGTICQAVFTNRP